MMHIPFLAEATRVLSFSSALQKPIFGDKHPQVPNPSNAEIPDGPFSFCEVSRPTDIFNITSFQLDRQPVYM